MTHRHATKYLFALNHPFSIILFNRKRKLHILAACKFAECQYRRIVDGTRGTHDSNLSVFNVPVPANFWGIFPDWWLPDNNNTLHPFLPPPSIYPSLSTATKCHLDPNWKNVKLFWPKCFVLTKCRNGCQCVICWIQIMWFVLSLFGQLRGSGSARWGWG